MTLDADPGLYQAVFLDRDGTLNEDPGYLRSSLQLRLFEGVPQALKKLKEAGYLLIVVSNQSGVGRGLIQLEELQGIHGRLNELLEPSGAKIDHFELCLHHPDQNCSCRKPKPELILNAASVLSIDLRRSYMVGDKASDISAGKNAGCKGVALVLTGEGPSTLKAVEAGLQEKPDYTGHSLTEVAKWILSQT